MDRRAELTALATDHVLVHGLIGLSLRPLAASIGTSDRMLVYHFGSKDALVTEVLGAIYDRAVATVAALTPSRSVRDAVLDLWAACEEPVMARCQRIYVEAAALGLLGQEPYAGVVREADKRWVQALSDHLVEAGLGRRRASRVVTLVDATFMGLQLDAPGSGSPTRRAAAVRDLADAVAASVPVRPAG